MWFDKSAVDENGNALKQAACTRKKEDLQTGSARFCCPKDAKAPAGVRCYTARVLP